MDKKQFSGFTLTELLVAVAIVGIIASIAVPSFARMIERNKLKEAAESLKADLMWLRTETIKRSCYYDADADGDDDGGLRIDFDTTSAWSYTIYAVEGQCGCPSGAGDCIEKVVNSTQFSGVSMSSAFSTGKTTRFDFRRGSGLVAGNAQLDSTNYHVKVVVAPVGRVRICNISGLAGLGGYAEC